MSLVAFATRLITCRAITGKTLAGTHVYNAPIEPLDYVLGEKPATTPVISVFSGAHTGEPEGRSFTRWGKHTMYLSIEIMAPPKIITPEGVVLRRTDEGSSAMALDFTWRQITAALVRENDVWPKLWAEFVLGINHIAATPVLYQTAPELHGVRVPAVQYVIDVRLANEPQFGVPLYELWARLDAAMRNEDDVNMTAVADMIKDMIEQPDELPSWRRVQATMGYSDAAIRAAGLAPQDETETGEAAELLEPVDSDNDADSGGIELDPKDLEIRAPDWPTIIAP